MFNLQMSWNNCWGLKFGNCNKVSAIYLTHLRHQIGKHFFTPKVNVSGGSDRVATFFI